MVKNILELLLDLGVESSRASYFINFELPTDRKLRSKAEGQWPVIEVGGDCLRVGKTTTKQVIVEQIGKRGLPFVFSDEDWKANNFLKDAYEGDTESLLNSQIWFVNKKRAQLKLINESSFWIQVVNPEMDFGYAMTNFLLGRLSKRQWESYWTNFQSLGWKEVPAPTLLIYLTADSEVLVSRFRNTARDFEKADENYIRTMQLVNQRWLSRVNRIWSVLEVKTNDFDYSYKSGSQRNRDRLGQMVFEKLKEKGWEF